MATATGQTTHTIHPKKGDNPLETLTPLAHRKINATKHETYEQRVSRDTVTNPTPNPNPGSPQNGHATWRNIITKQKGRPNKRKGKPTQTTKAPESEQASSLMRSMPVANNLHNENRPKRYTSDIGHTKDTKQKEEGKKKKKWNIKLNHQPKKRQRRQSFILGDSNWKFFQVGYPVDTPTDKNSWTVNLKVKE